MTKKKRKTTDRAEIERLIAGHGRWWRKIELAPGVFTPGDDSNRMKVPILDAIGFPRDMRGLRVLNIGCSDGFSRLRWRVAERPSSR